MNKNNSNSQQTEQEILEQYKPYLRHVVGNFIFRTHLRSPVLSFDDLMQEASIWLIKTYRKGGIDAVLTRRVDLHGTLCDAVNRSYPIRIPRNAFYRMSEGEYKFVPIKEGIQKTEDVEGAAVLRADLADAVSGLPPRDRSIVRMKAEGRTQHEIAQCIGVSDAFVSTQLKRIRSQLNEYLN